MRLVVGGALAFGAAIWACSDAYSGDVAGADAGSEASPSSPADGDPAVTPGPVLDETYTAGSRLQPNFLSVGSAKVFVDWWDTQLGVHCAFRSVAENEYRCVPKVFPALAGDSLFADIMCRKPAVVVQAEGTCAGSAVSYADVSKGCSPQIVKVGASSDGPYSGSQCEKKPSANAFVRGADLAMSDFVRATVEDGGEDLGTQLKAQYVAAEDGARGFFRVVLKPYPTTPCRFGPGASDPALRCYPPGFVQADAGANGDSKCSLPSTSPACAVDGPVFGNAVDPEVFGLATRFEVVAADTLALVYALLPTGHRVTMGWSDAAHGGACTFGPGTDDRLHCYPTEAGLVSSLVLGGDCRDGGPLVYSAAPALQRCRLSNRSIFGVSCPAACVLPPKPSFAVESTPVCSLGPPKKQLFQVGDTRPGFAMISAGGLGLPQCTALTRTDEAVYAATLVPPATLPAATVAYP